MQEERNPLRFFFKASYPITFAEEKKKMLKIAVLVTQQSICKLIVYKHDGLNVNTFPEEPQTFY